MGNHTATTSIARSPAKKKSSVKTTKKVLVSVLESPFASTFFVPTSTYSIIPDLEADLDLPRVDPDIEFELVVPRIIHELEGEEDMTANLKTGFKERQRKRLSESIVVFTPPAKKSCSETPLETPVPDTPPVPRPLADVVRSNNVPPVKSLIRKDTSST